MTAFTPQWNLITGWVWILLGFGSGLVLGLNFHREDWLGGYGTFKRRLYRLAHISFFGLGLVNLLFYFTLRGAPSANAVMAAASATLILGAITMPLCCVLMAHHARFRLLFGVPVFSLLTGGALTLWEVIKL